MEVIKWFKALFAWKLIGTKGAWAYYENSVSSKRKIKKKYLGHSPVDRGWLNGGEWSDDQYKIEGAMEEMMALCGIPRCRCCCHRKCNQNIGPL